MRIKIEHEKVLTTEEFIQEDNSNNKFYFFGCSWQIEQFSMYSSDLISLF